MNCSGTDEDGIVCFEGFLRYGSISSRDQIIAS